MGTQKYMKVVRWGIMQYKKKEKKKYVLHRRWMTQLLIGIKWWWKEDNLVSVSDFLIVKGDKYTWGEGDSLGRG